MMIKTLPLFRGGRVGKSHASLVGIAQSSRTLSSIAPRWTTPQQSMIRTSTPSRVTPVLGQRCIDNRCTRLDFFSSDTSEKNDLLEAFDLEADECNVPPSIYDRIGTRLHLTPNHPLHTIKSKIESHFNSEGNHQFYLVDDWSPIVPTHNNFDSLLIEPDHVSRSRSDTYYLNNETVLRTHTSAHQTTLLQQGYNQFLVTGDVYRRDEIDMSHYPIFHQMEGVKIFTPAELEKAKELGIDERQYVEHDLKRALEGMVKTLFGDVEMRWVDAYFPFTDPSFELEIYFADEWLEVLGCGVIQQDIMRGAGRGEELGWAFGLGLERLAMVLFSIPDIRLFWSKDERFHSQFVGGDIIKFQPYSKYPPCLKDISFWTSENFHANDLNEVVRNVAGDLVERVELIDSFSHPKSGQLSNCFRISYRSMDRSLTNAEVDMLQEQVRFQAVDQLGVELR